MLKTNKVFIDTQTYVKAGLHFEGVAFKAFHELCVKGDLVLITTTVVEREVKGKIEESIKDALQAINTVQRKARLLNSIDNGSLHGFFQQFNEHEIHEAAQKVFDDFLKGCHAKLATIEVIDLNEVLDKYFGKEPPFGQNKKKSEFPDAINLAAVERFVNDEDVYIISEDSDLKNYCDGKNNLHQIDSLDKFLGEYNTHTNELSNKLMQFIESKREDIRADVIAQLNDADGYNVSTWEDAELDSFEVVNIDDFEPSIIKIDNNYCLATFSVSLDFEVTVSGPDFNNGYWDSEDKVMIPMETTTRTEVQEISFDIEIEVMYEIEDGELTDIAFDVNIDKLSRGIEFSIEENNFEY
ncbi:TPA: PIN domain-containing protein [Escherichia coli]